MAWSPARRSNAGRFEVEHPGDYAAFNSYQPGYVTRAFSPGGQRRLAAGFPPFGCEGAAFKGYVMMCSIRNALGVTREEPCLSIEVFLIHETAASLDPSLNPKETEGNQ
jgi:hypothetical protein